MQAKGERTRQAVLEAAIRRFGQDGYRAASVADIARDAGVGGTVAYAYFPNKEALFLAAVDEDAAGVIEEGISLGMDREDWRASLMPTLVAAVERHPLARRLLAGLEPEVTERVLEVPALAELRKAIAEKLRSEQAAGDVRPDIDPVVMANGMVAIVLSLLMAAIKVGPAVLAGYADDITAVLRAAVDAPPSRPRRSRR